MATIFDDHERSQWRGAAEAYHGSFRLLCAHPAPALLDAAGVAAGTRVLDVGTGTGTVAALACARGAEVVAVDPEPSMVELAGRHVPAAEVRPAGLPHLPFAGGSFDAAVANFVLNHVGDPAAAAAELGRVVRPGGRVAVTIWPVPAPPAQQLWAQIFDAADAEPVTEMPRVAPDRDFPRTPDGLSRLLHDAGLTGIRCRTITWTHRTDPEAWWAGPANGLGRPGHLLRQQDQTTINRIRHQYDRITARHREPDGRLALPTTALLASATTNCGPGTGVPR